mgnify:CR=1 FL=1
MSIKDLLGIMVEKQASDLYLRTKASVRMRIDGKIETVSTQILSKEDILEAIANMTVMDVVELISAMEEKFGVTAAAAVAALWPHVGRWVWVWALSVPLPFNMPVHAGAGGYFAPHVRSYIRRSEAPTHIGAIVAAPTAAFYSNFAKSMNFLQRRSFRTQSTAFGGVARLLQSIGVAPQS